MKASERLSLIHRMMADGMVDLTKDSVAAKSQAYKEAIDKMPKPEGTSGDADQMYEKFKTESVKSEILNNNARLYAYKQVLDKELQAKNPKLFEAMKSGISSPDIKTRLAYADSVAKANPDFALSIDEQKRILGESYDDFDKLRNWRLKSANSFGIPASVSGENEQQQTATTAYGARNSAFYAPASAYKTYINAGTHVADYSTSATYDPVTKSYSYSHGMTTPVQ